MLNDAQTFPNLITAGVTVATEQLRVLCSHLSVIKQKIPGTYLPVLLNTLPPATCANKIHEIYYFYHITGNNH